MLYVINAKEQRAKIIVGFLLYSSSDTVTLQLLKIVRKVIIIKKKNTKEGRKNECLAESNSIL